MKPKYKVGDEVKIKDLFDLKREFGESIDVPSTWVDSMDAYAGGCFVVDYVGEHSDGRVYYNLSGADGWNYDECVLEDPPSVDIENIKIEMSFESLFQ